MHIDHHMNESNTNVANRQTWWLIMSMRSGLTSKWKPHSYYILYPVTQRVNGIGPVVTSQGNKVFLRSAFPSASTWHWSPSRQEIDEAPVWHKVLAVWGPRRFVRWSYPHVRVCVCVRVYGSNIYSHKNPVLWDDLKWFSRHPVFTQHIFSDLGLAIDRYIANEGWNCITQMFNKFIFHTLNTRNSNSCGHAVHFQSFMLHHVRLHPGRTRSCVNACMVLFFHKHMLGMLAVSPSFFLCYSPICAGYLQRFYINRMHTFTVSFPCICYTSSQLSSVKDPWVNSWHCFPTNFSRKAINQQSSVGIVTFTNNSQPGRFLMLLKYHYLLSGCGMNRTSISPLYCLTYNIYAVWSSTLPPITASPGAPFPSPPFALATSTAPTSESSPAGRQGKPSAAQGAAADGPYLWPTKWENGKHSIYVEIYWLNISVKYWLSKFVSINIQKSWLNDANVISSLGFHGVWLDLVDLIRISSIKGVI